MSEKFAIPGDECGSSGSGCRSTSRRTTRLTSCPIRHPSCWTVGASSWRQTQGGTSCPTRSRSFAGGWDVVPDDGVVIFTRMETPYRGVKRVPEGDNLWFGVIPGTAHEAGMAVTWAYRVFESRRAVRCDLIETLRIPL